MVPCLIVDELPTPHSRAMRCSLRGDDIGLVAVLKLSDWRASVCFCSMELWLGLGCGDILDLAGFLLTHSSPLPEPGVDGCAYLYRVMDDEVRSPLGSVIFRYI